jgi:hypothetical protein
MKKINAPTIYILMPVYGVQVQVKRMKACGVSSELYHLIDIFIKHQ